MAVLILVIFLFVVPDNFESKSSEYIFLDLPEEVKEIYLENLLEKDLDKKGEEVKIEVDGVEKHVTLYETEDRKGYLLNSREDIEYMADEKREVAAIVKMDENYNFQYEYYLQGYETKKLKDLVRILHVAPDEVVEKTMDSQDVRALSTDYKFLSDRENIIPSVLVFNGSLMGLFIIAAYIFLDRQEGVIKAYALTPSPVWQYLMSKVLVILTTSILSSFIVLIPIMGLKPNYPMLLLLLLTTGFFSSSLGLLIASFYKNLIQAFGAIYAFMMIMIIPNIAYFIPSWNPKWVRMIPTAPMLEGFKSILLGNQDSIYILTISVGFLFVGLILFLISNIRYKKTLA
jgi:fluoroquinolone transport system permease protein